MKRIVKSVIGVTLLEIMLVLAIAAMIIVMSVRYYQAATTSQQTTSAINLVLAIATGMDSLSIAGGSYTSIGSATEANASLKTYLGGPTSLNTTLGTTAEIKSVGASLYTVSMPLSPTVCQSVLIQLKGNPKIGGADTVPACDTGVLTYTYDRTK